MKQELFVQQKAPDEPNVDGFLQYHHVQLQHQTQCASLSGPAEAEPTEILPSDKLACTSTLLQPYYCTRRGTASSYHQQQSAFVPAS